MAHYGKGLPDEAITAYNRAIEIKPDYAEAYYNSSFAYLKKGLIEDAINMLKRELSLTPTMTFSIFSWETLIVIRAYWMKRL